MATTATKSSRTRSGSRPRSGTFFGAARGPGFFSSAARTSGPRPAVQAKLTVSSPGDSLEREADRTAERVMRMPGPAAGTVAAGAGSTSPQAARAASAPQLLQRFGEGTSAVAADAKSEIQRATTGGQALSSDVRGFMEPRLGVGLGDVRVHTDEGAASLSNHLSARAFTYRNHVFFARDQYQPGTAGGRHLLAHELAHTIQQGGTIQRAERGPAAEQHTPVPAPVGRAVAPPAVQRLGVTDALDYFADKAYYLPGFRMLTLLLGFNPINMRSSPRTAANFLRALIEMVPGGALITRVLDSHGVVDAAAAWVEQRLATLGDVGGGVVEGLRRFVASLNWSDILDLGGVWDRARRILTDPIDRLVAFGASVVGDLLDIVKRAVLRPLAALAEGTAGYDLLKAVLGQDPITGDPVPRTADALIGGFMKLIGQEEVWQNIKRGNAVGRAFAWFQGALAGLMGFVRSVPGRIVAALRSLTFEDVVTAVGAFRKVAAAFLGLAAEFGAWALKQVISLLEILFSVVAPGVMPYIAKAKDAFHTILRDPVAFIGNLARAAKLGFETFAGNILTHLKDALIKWITGPLGEAGVYIPRSFGLSEIVKLVLSVLGLTWQAVRSKLVKLIPDPVLAGLEKTAAVLVTLVTEGPAAAWEQIKAELSELKDQLIGQVTQMLQMEVVKAAVTKLVSMLNPAGAVIQAIVAIYNTVTFFIEKAKQIGAVVASFIDSIAAIAAGHVGGAAKRVEQTLASTLTVVITFLAKFAGIGGIPEKLVGIVKKIRVPIDKGLDKIVAWLGALLSKLVSAAKEGARRFLEWWRARAPIEGGDEPHVLTFEGERASARLVVRSQPEKPSEFLTREHKRAGQQAKTLTTPLNKTIDSEEKILALQTTLAKIDDNERAAASGKTRETADENSQKLNRALSSLAQIIGAALASWGVDGDMPEMVEVERAGGFTVSQKAKIAEEYLSQQQRLAGTSFAKTEFLEKDSKGRLISVAPDIDRRHVVSSNDMARHYGSVLAKKKLSAAKLLVEQSGSISDAREPIGDKKVTAKSVIAAAKRRYRRFFGYAKNIFLGDSSENRSIQELLDKGHPEMAGKKLRDHVARVKREWALDGDFKPSEDE